MTKPFLPAALGLCAVLGCGLASCAIEPFDAEPYLNYGRTSTIDSLRVPSRWVGDQNPTFWTVGERDGNRTSNSFNGMSRNSGGLVPLLVNQVEHQFNLPLDTIGVRRVELELKLTDIHPHLADFHKGEVTATLRSYPYDHYTPKVIKGLIESGRLLSDTTSPVSDTLAYTLLFSDTSGFHLRLHDTLFVSRNGW